MAEKSYFRMQLDSAIQETEKLLKALHSIVESRDLETALELSVTAAKISEGVALKTIIRYRNRICNTRNGLCSRAGISDLQF